MLEIDTHCDARGDTTYNDELSKQRAQAIATYLAWKGVAKDRLSLIWHGESQLANHCTDEATCEETDHRINRRAEFKLLTETVAVITE